jgi:Raf kinase inhibitor-like YbhB/YbcL family protein
MELTSTAYENGAAIPRKFATKAAGGSNVSPGFEWSRAPTATASFALVVVDQASVANYWIHWLVVDIPPAVTSLPEGASRSTKMPAGARELDSTFGSVGYGGPQPPAGTGAHAYVTTIYALDVPKLQIGQRATLAEFAKAADGHVLAYASYEGTFAP